MPELTAHVEAGISLLGQFGSAVRVDESDGALVVLVDARDGLVWFVPGMLVRCGGARPATTTAERHCRNESQHSVRDGCHGDW